MRLVALLACAAAHSFVSAGQEALVTPGPEANVELLDTGEALEVGEALGAGEESLVGESDPYVEKYDTRGSVSVGARMLDVQIAVSPPDSDIEVGYKTTGGGAFGGQITWEDSALSYFQDSVLVYSKYGRRYGFDAYYYDYSEFEYDYDLQQPVTVTGYYPKGLHARGFGASLHRVFNSEKFSFPAAHGHAERQLSSCGSLMAIVSVSAYEVGADEPLIPPALQGYYEELGTLERAQFFTITGAAGCIGTKVLSPRRFLLGSVILGFGLQRHQFETADSSGDGGSGTVKALFHMAYGHDLGAFFFRFAGKVDWEVQEIGEDENKLSFQHLTGTFTFGVRF